MAIPFLTPARCVLMIGDDALHVFNVSFRASRLVDSVPWNADNFDDTVVGLIRKECGGKPVLILNDMTDQHFKGGQRLPKVGLMDKANVLTRKLQVAFPASPIRGALPITQSKADKKAKGAAAGADKDAKQSGELYLFAAVSMSEPVAKTMDVVRRSLASIAGFYLLPVESSDMVKALSAKLTAKGRKPSRWVIFIGQHHSGALRQVIIRDGQLAMTRMTPVADTDTDHELWAREVFQEFKATVSYLSRFGFSPEDGADVIVVGHPIAGKNLEKLIDIPCNYSTFTAPEAARELGITIGLQEDPRYADVLHAAWIGRKTKFILPMKAEELKKVGQPRQIAAAAMFLLILGAGYFCWQAWSNMQTISETSQEIGKKQKDLKLATTANEEEQAKMKALGFDVKLVEGAIKTFKDLDSHRLSELLLIKKIDETLGDGLRLDELNIDRDITKEGAAVPPPANGQPAKQAWQAHLRLSFPPTIEIEVGVREINNLKRRLEAALPNCVVSIDQNVAGLEYNDTFTGETGINPSNENKPQQYIVQLTIKGTL